MKRHGFTMMEMMVSLALTSALLTLTVQLIQQSMRLSARTQRQNNSVQSAFRFGEQFRRDAQHATGIENQGDGKWKFTLSDQSLVTYAVSDHSVIVNRSRNGKFIGRDSLFDSPHLRPVIRFDAPTNRISLVTGRAEIVHRDSAIVETAAAAIVGQRVSSSKPIASPSDTDAQTPDSPPETLDSSPETPSEVNRER